MRRLGIGILLSASLAACVSSAPPPRPLDLPFERFYMADFDTVWTATVEVLESYQIVRIDRDAGSIETDWSEARFNRALYDVPDTKDILESVKYRLKIKVSKFSHVQTSTPAGKVQIVKELMEGRNFIQDYQRIPSDTVEEQVLLYRIGQRINIAKALKRKSVGAKNSVLNEGVGVPVADPTVATPPPGSGAVAMPSQPPTKR